MNSQDRDYRGDKQKSQECKVFIGGLSVQATKEDLLEHFGQWGAITDAVVINDPESRRSRGFGFVTFETLESMEQCFSNRPHNIVGKEVEIKRAVPREDSNPNAHLKTKKVFLGGLSLATEEADIREVLGVHGEIDNVQIMTDKESGKPRGFGFVTYTDFNPVDDVCCKKFIKIKDRDVEVKKAISQEEMRRDGRPSRGGRSGGGGGGRGGGGGGGSYYGGRSDMYVRSSMGGGGGGYRDYSRQMHGGYESGGYGPNPYYMGASYQMGYDRSAAATSHSQGYGGGYDYYGGMYSGASAMGAYGQSTSGYGPQRAYGTPRDQDRGGMSGGRSHNQHYHPYQR